MKIALFSTKPYDKHFLDDANQQFHHELAYINARLNGDTLMMAGDAPVLSIFVNDSVDEQLLARMQQQGVRMLALRSAGFNHVDINAANRLGILVANVPDYSPYAVAEHATALLLCMVRHLIQSHNRVREGNYALDGLMGFDLHEKTVGIVGTGNIGLSFARIMNGFGCRLLGTDPVKNPRCLTLGMRYVSLEHLLAESDIVSLHCPLLPATQHLINEKTIDLMKPGVCLINTSRGAVVDTRAAIAGLKSGHIGAFGLDVYEGEGPLYFEDHTADILQDDTFARLQAFGNVLITGHHAFFTREAVANIARTTLENVAQFETSGDCRNRIAIA